MGYAGISRRQPGGASNILNVLLQRYMASSEEMKKAKSQEQRLQTIQDALSKVYPGIAGDKYKGMAELIMSGAAPSSAMIDDAMNAELLDEVLQQLDPEVANSIRLAPPGEKGEMAGLALSAKAQKEQAEADYNQFVELYDSLPKTSEGYPDWNKVDGENKIKYGTLLSKITPGNEADKSIEALWNILSFGEPNEESKGQSIYGVSLKKGLLYEKLAQYADKSYDEIPPLLRMTAKGENVIEGAEDWAKARGDIRVTPKVMTMVGSVIQSEIESLLPNRGPAANWKTFKWAMEKFDEAYFQNNAEAKAALGERLYNAIESNYVPGTTQIKDAVMKQRVVDYLKMMDEIDGLLELEDENESP